MKKTTLFFLLASMASVEAFAGGYLTNTNQNAAFGRNLSQEAMIDIMATYANPAGVGFLAPGWYLALSNQSAFQTRTIESSFGNDLFRNGKVNGIDNNSGMKTYKGTATAPLIPSFDVAYVRNRWSLALHFAISGGGGKCEFDDGLGSFESQVAILPVLANALKPGAVAGYSFDTYMKGRQYYFGTQLTGSYKVTDHLNVAVGLRMVNASCAYEGYVKNIGLQVNTPQGVVPMSAADFLRQGGMGEMAAMVADRVIDCTQSGTGFTPVIGIDWRINDQWNVAAKYEFQTKLTLKNSTASVTNADGTTSQLNAGLSEYNDGAEIRADIPAILTLGVQYSPVRQARINVGGHLFFDEQATQHANRHEKLNGPGWEITAGAEYDINKLLTVSAGWQNTNYGLGKNSEFISDLSFVTNSNSVGIGARLHLSKKVDLDVSYFKTLYSHYERTQADYNYVKAGLLAKVNALTEQMQAAVPQLQAAAGAGNAEAAAQLQALQQKGAALAPMAAGLNSLNTSGYDNFTRTNDVIGVGVSVKF